MCIIQTCLCAATDTHLHQDPFREDIAQEIAELSARTELDVEVGEMVLVDFGGRYGQLPCKVVDDPEVVEGQLYVRSMEKTRRGNFKWPCKCGKDMSEWICCEEKGCRKVTWIDNDTVIKRLDSGENVQDGFSFKM